MKIFLFNPLGVRHICMEGDRNFVSAIVSIRIAGRLNTGRQNPDTATFCLKTGENSVREI